MHLLTVRFIGVYAKNVENAVTVPFFSSYLIEETAGSGCCTKNFEDKLSQALEFWKTIGKKPEFFGLILHVNLNHFICIVCDIADIWEKSSFQISVTILDSLGQDQDKISEIMDCITKIFSASFNTTVLIKNPYYIDCPKQACGSNDCLISCIIHIFFTSIYFKEVQFYYRNNIAIDYFKTDDISNFRQCIADFLKVNFEKDNDIEIEFEMLKSLFSSLLRTEKQFKNEDYIRKTIDLEELFETQEVEPLDDIQNVKAQPSPIDIIDTTIAKGLTSKRRYSATLEVDSLETKKKLKNELAYQQNLEKYILKNGFDPNDTDHIKIRKKLLDEYEGFESKIMSCEKKLISLSKKILSTHEAFQIDQWQKNQAEENLVLQSLLRRKEKLNKLFDKGKKRPESLFDRAKRGNLFS